MLRADCFLSRTEQGSATRRSGRFDNSMRAEGAPKLGVMAHGFFQYAHGARRQLLLPVSDNYFCRRRGSKGVSPTTGQDSVTKDRLVA
jgi:hypothetical protein